MSLRLKGRMQQSGIIWKVLLLLALMLVLTVLAMVIWALCFGSSQTTVSLKVLQMLQSVGTFLLPCLAAVYLWSEKPVEWLKLDKSVGWKEGVAVVLLIVCASPGINLLAWLNEKIALPDFLSGLEELMKSQEEAAAGLTERFIKADNAGILLLNLLLLALLPALCEETMFRGTLQQLFYTPAVYRHEGVPAKNSGGGLTARHHAAVWVSAIIFSTIHFQFYGFVPRMLLGALFGYLLLWSGTLWLPVLAHFTNNAMAVLLYNMYYMKGKNVDEIDAFGAGDTWWLGLISLLLTGLGIYIVRRICLHEKNYEHLRALH
ncbi:MAG: CPBP family intramembrane metalloprotease [Paludibacteraceae bacterium]|nr:CPBP family intramembrane metalloprotease [Paludibacteraceae bacterium]